MAISSTVSVNDRMSAPLNSILNSLNAVISSFEKMQTVSNNAIDVSNILDAQSSLAEQTDSLNRIESSINDATESQTRFNRELNNANKSSSSLLSSVKKLAITIGSYKSITKLIGTSDEYSLTKSRLDMINDGLQTTQELQNKVFGAAQRSRGEFSAMAANVSKLGLLAGSAFKSNDEIIKFSEIMNKAFTVGGAGAQEASSAMYQLTQAMASGRLQGDEFRSIIENAPMLAQAIAEYTGVGMKGLKEMSSDGLITADIIKASLFNAADDIQRKFDEMPMTFGQLWNTFKNNAMIGLQPVYNKLSQIANSKGFNTFINNVSSAVGTLGNVLVWVLELVIGISNFISENWPLIEPIVTGIALVVGWLTMSLLAQKAAVLAVTAVEGARTVTTTLMALATGNATKAQWSLNGALYACPLTWIIAGIIAVIAIIVLIIKAISEAEGQTVSTMGVVCGVLATGGAFIGNLFMALLKLTFGVIEFWYNGFGAFANFFANVFNDPIASVINLFADLADSVLGVLESIASAMDYIFGSNMAGTVAGWRSDLKSMAEDAVKEYSNGSYKDAMDELNIDQILNDFGVEMERFNYQDAYKSGYNFGNSIGGSANSLLDQANKYANFSGTGDGLGKSAEDIANTSDNTKKIADSMEISSEDIKYLRDIAEKEAINKFTTAEIKVDMTNNNNISSDMDLDGITEYLTDSVEEAMKIAAEGV